MYIVYKIERKCDLILVRSHPTYRWNTGYFISSSLKLEATTEKNSNLFEFIENAKIFVKISGYAGGEKQFFAIISKIKHFRAHIAS